jgi:predicted acetyltransferase
VKEFIDSDSNNDSTEHYLKRTLEQWNDTFEDFVKEKMDHHKGIVAPGLVPCTQFWIIDDNGKYCGRVSFRHALNEKLAKHGGHIGYDVRPSMRGKNYATIALGLCLKEAKKMGLEKVLLTCDDDNIPSIKTIEKNNGVLQDKVPQDNGVLTRRYWIDLE